MGHKPVHVGRRCGELGYEHGLWLFDGSLEDENLPFLPLVLPSLGPRSVGEGYAQGADIVGAR